RDCRVKSMTPSGFDGREKALQLSFGLTFRDLYDRDGLVKVDRAFVAFLGKADMTLSSRLAQARQNPAACDRAAHAAFALDLASHVENFIAELFDITGAVSQLQKRHQDLAVLHEVKRTFVQRRAVRARQPKMRQKSMVRRLRRSLPRPLPSR